MKIRDRKSRALLEVSVTVHPEAIREMLIGRDGFLWRFARFAGFLALLYFSLGFELTSGKYFAELGFHPTVLLLAYLASRSSLVRSLCAAIICGAILDAGSAAPLGFNALLLTASTGVASLFHNVKREPGEGRFWITDALSGGCANALYVIILAAIRRSAMDEPRMMLVGISLAFLSYMPCLAFLLDFVRNGFRSSFARNRRISSGQVEMNSESC